MKKELVENQKRKYIYRGAKLRQFHGLRSHFDAS